MKKIWKNGVVNIGERIGFFIFAEKILDADFDQLAFSKSHLIDNAEEISGDLLEQIWEEFKVKFKALIDNGYIFWEHVCGVNWA